MKSSNSFSRFHSPWQPIVPSVETNPVLKLMTEKPNLAMNIVASNIWGLSSNLTVNEIALREKLMQMSLGKNPTADLSDSPAQSIGYRQTSRDNLMQAAKNLWNN